MVVHAMKNAEATDRKRLAEILRMHSNDKRTVDEFISILKKCGAVDYARKKAQSFAKESWDSIKGELPQSEAKDWIEWLTDFAVSRIV
jgi:octaprenyl-diphosphate synthase